MANVYQIVTDRILESLEAGIVPWQRPWITAAPMNLTTKKPYRGINVWLTSARRYTSPYWLTFKQAKDLGASVRKGERGTPIVYYTTFETDKTYPDGTPKTGMVLRYYTVFNTDQIDGLTDVPALETRQVDPIETAEAIVAGMPQPPALEHGHGAAWYRPSADLVGLPSRETFKGAGEYYSTLFHELAHATGHASRIGRVGVMEIARFGSETYSKEELIAEMTAAFLCGQAGIDSTVENSAAYLASWVKALKGDSRLIVSAGAGAQKAADWILGKTEKISVDMPES